MIQINIGDHSGNENGVAFTKFPANKLGAVRWARRHAFRVARGNPRANAYFKTLSSGRSLSNLLNDNTIWINYDPSLTVDGSTFHNNDLWIGPGPFRISKWQVLATLIHELAHIGGAGGAATGLVCTAHSTACHAAELAVYHCGMGRRSERIQNADGSFNDDPFTPYNPNIIG